MMNNILNKIRSHCCLSSIEDVGGFPYTCSSCGGACEAAEPTTPTHEETARGYVMHTLNKVASGTLSTQDAHVMIMGIIEDEKRLLARDFGDKVIQRMKEKTTFIQNPDSPFSVGIVRGFQSALHRLTNVLDSML